MKSPSTLEKLQAILQGIFGDHLTFTRNSSALDIEAWDSVQHVTIVLEAEKEFGVAFSVSEIAYLKNLGDLVDLIDGKLRNRARSGTAVASS